MKERKKLADFIIISLFVLSSFVNSQVTLAGPTLPADYTKPGVVDCDKFTEPTVTVEGDVVSYSFNWDSKYNTACGMANAAALLWSSGYNRIKDSTGQSQTAASLYDYFKWICDDYANYVGGGNDPYPWMGLGQQKSYMEKYLKDPKTNPNSNPKPRRVVDAHANVSGDQNYPLTNEQVNSLKQKLYACSLVSLIIQRQEDGKTQNHEVQMIGWTSDGRFKIFDPDTDRAIWDEDAGTFTFEDTEYWGSSLTDNKWRLSPEGTSESWDVVAYKVFSVPAPGAVLLGGMGMGLVGWLRRRRML